MFWLEVLSYLVTILGLPLAIWVFLQEQRRQRENETYELHRNLSEEYDNFLRLVLDNADLLLLSNAEAGHGFSDEQRERRDIIFRMLIGLFEKAFIILYDDDLSGDAERNWRSWEDDMREWCARPDFRSLLPVLLEGEDEAFSRHILAIARQASPERA